MPAWSIVLIVLVIMFFASYFIWWHIHVNNCVEEEINRRLSNIGKKDYTWKDEDKYLQLKKEIKDKIIDHRSGTAFKPRYKSRDTTFMKDIDKIVSKYYEIDNKTKYLS